SSTHRRTCLSTSLSSQPPLINHCALALSLYLSLPLPLYPSYLSLSLPSPSSLSLLSLSLFVTQVYLPLGATWFFNAEALSTSVAAGPHESLTASLCAL